MTRDELIARIEAGETGPEIDAAIYEIDAAYRGLGYCGSNRPALTEKIPEYTRDIDAAISLVGVGYWLGGPEVYTSIHPASALVAAWLKATA